jgi:plastocyanin
MLRASPNQQSVLLAVSFAVCLLFLGLVGSLPVQAQRDPVQVSIVSGASTLTTTAYSPDVITVVIGVNNTVVWKNNDNVIHSATGTNLTGFDTGAIEPGATASYTFNTPGTYPYHCIYHLLMSGRVIVKAAVASTASTTSSGGGGVPEFPYQSTILVALTFLLVASYLIVRRGKSPHP